MLVLVAGLHFRSARLRTRAAAWLFGRHQPFEHIGYRGRIAWWRDRPYLLTFREVTP
ncbi:hypothetical protein [Acidimangrovimonas sediminis]|uniref:hypothetical protein n=1 Tax=Acidimangrovimonas sediminis TaxID=2056283 RepID=UPI0013048E21|nr:hypothetical protein [Acidimangrovimonas sediminis]